MVTLYQNVVSLFQSVTDSLRWLLDGQNIPPDNIDSGYFLSRNWAYDKHVLLMGVASVGKSSSDSKYSERLDRSDLTCSGSCLPRFDDPNR